MSQIEDASGSKDGDHSDFLKELLRRIQHGDRAEVESLLRDFPAERQQMVRGDGSVVVEPTEVLPTARVPVGNAAPSDDRVPPALGDFELLREIGRGGMGVVYEARQVSLNKSVALKILSVASVLDPRSLQRFQNEARAASQHRSGSRRRQ